MEEFSLIGDAQWLYFSLELGADENVGRIILFHLNASCVLGFYRDFPKLRYKTNKQKSQNKIHILQFYFNLGFAMPLEFEAFEVTLVCKTLVTALQTGAGVVPAWLHVREAHGTAAFLRGLCFFPCHRFLYPIKETSPVCFCLIDWKHVCYQIYLRGSCGETVSYFQGYSWVFSLKLWQSLRNTTCH